MIDGSFFLKRYSATYGRNHSDEVTAKNLFEMAVKHLDPKSDLYRIFFYDCPPLSKKAHNPVTQELIDFSKTPLFTFRTALREELVKKRKLALRMGRLSENPHKWSLTPKSTKDILNKSRSVDDLTPSDVTYQVTQKGVDMKIGLDIASLSFKRLVKRIVLVTGDADFVPAAKFARREGIDVILDPMWKPISADLFEHIDGLNSVCPKPKSMKKKKT